MSSLSLLAAARECGQRSAVVTEAGAVSYAAWLARVRGAAAWLADAGVDAADPAARVALVPEATLDGLALLHALVDRGIPFVPLHPRLTESERRALLDLAAPVTFVSAPPILPPDGPALAPRAVSDAATLAIVFTSGTTGQPKGAILSRRAFVASAAASASNLPLAPDDRWLLAMPPAHVGGLSIVTRSLLARSAVVLPTSGPFAPSTLASSVARHGVTLLSLVPTMLDRLLDLEPRFEAPPHLRAILLGGAPAPARLLRRAAERGLPVLTTYGLTEACSQVTTQRAGTLPDPARGSGAPLPGIEVRIVDGAIEVRGPTCMDGYFPRGAFADPFDAEGWMRTGDIGELDEAGRLHVHARRTDLVLSGGENVYPAEVEEALEALPGIARACVFGVDDARWGQKVAAALVADAETGPPSEDALRAHLRTRLAGHKRPRLVAWVESLPEGRVGKIDRGAARDRFAAALRPLWPASSL